MKTLVTGVAGFIGSYVAKALLKQGHKVIGVDSLNDYYDPLLKHARLNPLTKLQNFRFIKLDLANRQAIEELFAEERFSAVVHLAAQAGVRYSLHNPHAYIESNITGFLNILEGCRHVKVAHLVFASSSSVYGANAKTPFSVHDGADHPVSLYGATKKANEMMAHSYAHLYGFPVTGLRFFTVYGPWGRPDMSPFIFTRKILGGEPIDVFNHGRHQRDFTYIDDIVEGVVKTLAQPAVPQANWNPATPDPASSSAPYRLYNIGNNNPVELMHFIACIEKATGKKAIMNMLPMQPGDVLATYADIDSLTALTGFKPCTSVETGIERFVGWYRDFYSV
ncbi:MAG: NAD-dependent epimerase [Hyphomicrobiales bacterium]|nr:NAD-dependent epimerase [Hyphomicrobiales bacterium]